ncbi:MAG TPA: DsbA family protein [Chitinophagaceae bacterium]|nr:DsbA family protein [Chitinophagaceae bacterium]
MNYTLYYCYDAWCGWCYGFSPVIRRIAEEYRDRLQFEVLSGGMIHSEKPRPIGVMAAYIRDAYPMVEERTGIRFGPDFLWHILHPEQSDWFPDSEKAAIALCIVKEFYPDYRQVLFAADLQYALNYEGRDLTDDEAYRHLLEKWDLDAGDFYRKLHLDTYRQKAHYEFALCRQLQVTGFPTALLQVSETRLYLLARGYTDYETFQGRLEAVLREAATPKTT